jgi:hypothetical protein
VSSNIPTAWNASTKTCKIYTDGFESSYDTRTASEGVYDSEATYDKEMGRMAYNGGIQFFEGMIDEVKIFNRVLSDAELLQLASDF